MARKLNSSFAIAVDEMISMNLYTQGYINQLNEENALRLMDGLEPLFVPYGPTDVTALTSKVYKTFTSFMPDLDNIFAEVNREFVKNYGCTDEDFTHYQANFDAENYRVLAGEIVYNIAADLARH